MNAKPGHASYHLESQVDLQIAVDSIKGVNVEAARLMSALGYYATTRDIHLSFGSSLQNGQGKEPHF
jgi:hypothetical protein